MGRRHMMERGADIFRLFQHTPCRHLRSLLCRDDAMRRHNSYFRELATAGFLFLCH